MDQVPTSDAAAKRERIMAISRTVHSIPVEEGGQLRPPRPVVAPKPDERSWMRGAVAASGIGALALGFAAGLFAGRWR